MKLLVDGEPTDEFGRPGEDQTVGEFLDDINRELGKTNRVVSEVAVDDQPLTDSLREIYCRDVDQLEISVSTMEELTIDSIGQLGTYCHRFLDRVPDLVDEWETYSSETMDEYRNQVLEALSAATQILSSVDQFTNVPLEETESSAMLERAQDLREELSSLDSSDVGTMLEESLTPFFEDLLQSLQEILDQLEERRESLGEEIERIQSVIDDLYANVRELMEDAQEKSDQVTEWLDIERVRGMSSQLTEVNQVFDQLDQSGYLKSAVPADQQEEVRSTMKELREGIGRLFGLMEDREPVEIVSTLRKDIEPYLKEAQSYLEAIDPGEADDSD